MAQETVPDVSELNLGDVSTTTRLPLTEGAKGLALSSTPLEDLRLAYLTAKVIVTPLLKEIASIIRERTTPNAVANTNAVSPCLKIRADEKVLKQNNLSH